MRVYSRYSVYIQAMLINILWEVRTDVYDGIRFKSNN